MRPQLDMRDYLLPSGTEMELHTLIRQLENGKTLVISSLSSSVLPTPGVDGDDKPSLSVCCYSGEIHAADHISS